MSGKRERGISYGPTVMLNLVNDDVCGGASNAGTGATLYGGILGIEIEFTDDQVFYSTSATIKKLYGGVYKYVHFLSTGGNAVAGQVVFWSDVGNTVVTCTASSTTDGNQAGIALNEVTAGNFGWIQVGGLANVLMADSFTIAESPAIKEVVVVKATDIVGDVESDATPYTNPVYKRLLGILEQAGVAGVPNLVQLLDRFSSPDK